MLKQEKSSPLPLYFKVIMNVKEKIFSGVWPVGMQIPGEISLAEELGVSLITVRQAMAQLVQQGYLLRERGRGSFVIWQGPLRQSVELEVDAAAAVDADSRFKLLSLERVAATPEVRRRLQLKEDTAIGRIVRLRMRNEEPLAHITSYMRYETVARLPESQLSRLPLANAVEAFASLAITEVKHTIGAVLSEHEISNHLNLPSGSPVLLIERDYYSRKKNIIVSTGHYRSDVFRYELKLSVEQGKRRFPWRHSSWVRKDDTE